MNALASWPNSSLSSSVSVRAVQLRATNRWSLRGLLACSARATSSLPVPVSPRIRTAVAVGANRLISLHTRAIAGLWPITRVGPAAGPGGAAAENRTSSAGRVISRASPITGPRARSSDWKSAGLGT